MPQLWAYGGGVFDEADANPTYQEVRLNSDASKRALQASYDMMSTRRARVSSTRSRSGIASRMAAAMADLVTLEVSAGPTNFGA